MFIICTIMHTNVDIFVFAFYIYMSISVRILTKTPQLCNFTLLKKQNILGLENVN